MDRSRTRTQMDKHCQTDRTSVEGCLGHLAAVRVRPVPPAVMDKRATRQLSAMREKSHHVCQSESERTGHKTQHRKTPTTQNRTENKFIIIMQESETKHESTTAKWK